MKRLKLSGSNFAGYTGVIGGIDFKDGITAYPVPTNIANRLTAAMNMVEVDEDGNEAGFTGLAYRLIAEAEMRAPVIEPLKLQTEDERKEEDLQNALSRNKAPVDKFYTGEELEDIASNGGIKALRAIGEPWNVKGKAIPGLILSILNAQRLFTDSSTEVIKVMIEPEKAVVPVEPDVLAKSAPEYVAPEGEDKTQADLRNEAERLKNAAIAGDLSAAFSTDPELIEVAQKAIDEGEVLLGSSILASTYDIEGNTVQLGDLVAGAFELSGFTAVEWNSLPDDEREDLIRLELDRRLPKE